MPTKVRLVGSSDQWTVLGSRFRIGQDARCEIRLAAARYPMVASQHVTVTTDQGGLRFADLKSPAGTFVNGIRLVEGSLANRGRIRLGDHGPEFEIELLATDPPDAPARIVNFSKHDFSKRDFSKRNIPKRDFPQPTFSDQPGAAEPEPFAPTRIMDASRLAAAARAGREPAGTTKPLFPRQAGSPPEEPHIAAHRASFLPQSDTELSPEEQEIVRLNSELPRVEDQFIARLNNDMPKVTDKLVDRELDRLNSAASKALSKAPQ